MLIKKRFWVNESTQIVSKLTTKKQINIPDSKRNPEWGTEIAKKLYHFGRVS